MFSQDGGSLLAYVVSRLRPDVFAHPIWINFGNKEKQVSPETIDELLTAAKQLQKDDPEGACQILLICAVHQNYGGRRDKALEIMQQMLALAEQHALSNELLWAAWGACAVCYQAGDFEQTVGYLQRLQTLLNTKNEWMLANYVETVAQALHQQANTPGEERLESPSDFEQMDLMHRTFDWLDQWGFSAHSTLPEFQPTLNSIEHTDLPRPIFSGRRWKGYWQFFKRVAKGEMKLRWVPNGVHQRDNRELQATKPYRPVPVSNQPGFFRPPTQKTRIQDHPQQELVTSSRAETSSIGASLLVYCLGPFQVYFDEQSIDDWHSSKGKAVFKYLMTHRERPVLKDVLMDLFWPDVPAETARNNLNVAIYGLRQALRKTRPSFSHVLFINDCYMLNPELGIWLDYESFLEIIATARKLEKNGDLEAAITEYGKAEALYQGEFLEEDRYEDWLLPLREKLQTEYLILLDRLNHRLFEKQNYQVCIHLCRKMLAIDPCSEEAHRHLMRCFFERGQAYMALRQYHLCVEALKEELNVAPTTATKELYETIRRHS